MSPDQPRPFFSPEDMPKSEYYEPKLQPGEKPVPSILVDAEKLHRLLKRAKWMMSGEDRRTYWEPAFNGIREVIREFVLAHDFQDNRLEHLERMCGAVALFIRDMRDIGEAGAIRVQPKYESIKPDEMKLELYNRVASLDEGVTKWRKSIIRATKNKGTPGSE